MVSLEVKTVRVTRHAIGQHNTICLLPKSGRLTIPSPFMQMSIDRLRYPNLQAGKTTLVSHNTIEPRSIQMSHRALEQDSGKCSFFDCVIVRPEDPSRVRVNTVLTGS